MSTENEYLAKTESLQTELEPVCRVITVTVKAEAVDAVKAIRRALLPLQTMSLDILVYRADTFFRRAQGATMERKIKRDGIPLYENFSHKS